MFELFSRLIVVPILYLHLSTPTLKASMHLRDNICMLDAWKMTNLACNLENFSQIMFDLVLWICNIPLSYSRIDHKEHFVYMHQVF